jgi:integrase
MKNRKVAASPVKDVERRKLDNTRIRYLNQHAPWPTGNPKLDALATEEDRLRAAIRIVCPDREASLDLALATGLRDEEQRTLTWDEVDFDARVLTLRHTKAGKKQQVKLSAAAIRALTKLRAQAPQSRLVCPPDAPGSNRRADWDRVRALVKLDEKTRGREQAFHWHDLRHTFASRLVMAGVDILTVKELMRHKTLDVTLRYAHLAPSHLVEALDKLDEYNAERCKGSVMASESAPLPAPATVN